MFPLQEFSSLQWCPVVSLSRNDYPSRELQVSEEKNNNILKCDRNRVKVRVVGRTGEHVHRVFHGKHGEHRLFKSLRTQL